jgi:peroxiredoxin
VNVHKQFSADEGISYTLLADPNADIIGAFGLINPGVAKTSSWYGIALPAIFVIDQSGTITHRFSTENYRQRPDVDRVLATLSKQ